MRAKRRFCFQHDMDEVVAEHAQAAAASALPIWRQWWRQQQHDKEAEGDTKAGHSIADAQEAAQTSHTLSVSTAIEAYAFR